MSARAVGIALCALAVMTVALSTGAGIYYLVLCMLLIMLALALLTTLATLFTIQVESRTPTARVTRGDSVAMRLFVRRLTALPLGNICLVFSSPQDDGASGKLGVVLRPYSGREYRYLLNCPHRGHYTVGVRRVEVTDVFGLFTFGRNIQGNLSELNVMPRVNDMPPMLLTPGDLGPQARIQMTEDAASPSDVRAWQDGDVLKKVHWKLTMRKRELMVRTFEESARPDTLVLMDVSPVSATRSQALLIEDALCEAAVSVVKAQLTADHPVRMPLTSGDPLELSGQTAVDFPRFLDAMTMLKFDGPFPYEQVLSLEMRRMQRTGGVIFITSRLNAAIADLAIKMRRFDMQATLIWVTENSRGEAMELLTRIELTGIKTRKIDPWPENNAT